MQEAQEGNRPTSVENTPESIKSYLSSDQNRLYKLIWERFLGGQMASAELLTRAVEISAGQAVFRASATEIKFAGFSIVYNRIGHAAAEKDDTAGDGADS